MTTNDSELKQEKYLRQDMPLTEKKRGVLFLPHPMNNKDWELVQIYLDLAKEADRYPELATQKTTHADDGAAT